MSGLFYFVIGAVAGMVIMDLSWSRKSRLYKQLLSAADNLVLDIQERQRHYPGFYRQPHLAKVLNELDIALAYCKGKLHD